MKKIMFCFSLCMLFISSLLLSKNTEIESLPYTLAFSSGYVFKNDCLFKDIYGFGAINVITTDFCYYPWHVWGLGAKVSYLRAKGHTSFLSFCTLMQEVPVTFYARRAHNFDCGLQLYGSLGGGFALIKEKSYLATITAYKGVGEIEVGLHYKLWECLNFTSAFRYLFPRQFLNCNKCEAAEHTKIDVGGCDLRAGFSFLF